MTTRHTVEPDDQRVPVGTTTQRRGAMYMRAEARRAAELGQVATMPAPEKRSRPRRIQLAALAAVWLLVAGITAVFGVRWAREDRTPPPPVVTVSSPPSHVAGPIAPKQAPTPATATSAGFAPVAPRTGVTPPPVSAPARVSAPGAAAANRAATPNSAVVALKSASTPTPVPPVSHVSARTREAVSTAVTPARPAARRGAPAAARLVVTSSPTGAVVTVDGIGWGATPARIGYLPPGSKRVRVTKEGYASQEATIHVGESGTTTLNVQLRPSAR